MKPLFVFVVLALAPLALSKEGDCDSLKKCQDALKTNRAAYGIVQHAADRAASLSRAYFSTTKPYVILDPNSTTYTEQLPDGGTLTEVVRVFYFTNSTSPRRIQETANTIRAITDISRPMPIFNERRAIVLRGRLDRMALAEWLFNELNQLPTAQRARVLQYRLSPATADPDHSYLSGTANAQQVFNAIHSSIKMPDSRQPNFPRMMPDTEQNVLVVRASDSQMADAEKLVQQLDSPSTKQ